MPAKVVGAGSEGTPESGGEEGATKWCEIKKRRKKREEEKSKRDEKKKVERKKEGRKEGEREREGRKENKKTEEEGRGWFGEERKSEQTRPVGGDLRNGRGCWCRRDKK